MENIVVNVPKPQPEVKQTRHFPPEWTVTYGEVHAEFKGLFPERHAKAFAEVLMTKETELLAAEPAKAAQQAKA
jgi:hypothetical protein